MMNKQKYYHFKERFDKMTDQELVDSFNREVGITGWVSARGFYLHYLREEFLKRSIDISSVNHNGFSLKSQVKLVGSTLIIQN